MTQHLCCCYSVAKSHLTLCDPMDCSMPGFPVHHYLPEFAQTHVVALVIPPVISSSVSRFSSCPQSFSTVHIRWPKYWSFSFNISPSNEYSGLISFRIDWFDLLDIQGTLKSLLQHHSLKASVFQYSVLSMVLLSHLYMTALKTIALTRQIFVNR